MTTTTTTTIQTATPATTETAMAPATTSLAVPAVTDTVGTTTRAARAGGADGGTRELLTPAEVAALFRVDPKTVTRWAKAGRIACIRTIGGHRRYPAGQFTTALTPAALTPAGASANVGAGADIGTQAGADGGPDSGLDGSR